jgi:hypothetical protein
MREAWRTPAPPPSCRVMHITLESIRNESNLKEQS